MSRLSPSVAMELGLSIARGMPSFILFNTEEQQAVPPPFDSLEYVRYAITPKSVERMVEEKLIPFLANPASSRGRVTLGPVALPPTNEASGVFISLPGTDYYQETILPRLRSTLESADLGPIRTEQEGRALSDLQRATSSIAASRFCLIDTTWGAPTRALYLGMAQGYRRSFANLIDADADPETRVFANARSKSEYTYRDGDELISRVSEFFSKFGITV